jgi:hypothetical protein
LNNLDIAGKTLAEVAPALYAEVLAGLTAGTFSPGGCVPEPDEVDRLAVALTTAHVAERCTCGQANCATYRFAQAEDGAEGRHTLRILVRGDLQVHFDSAGGIDEVERLYDATDDGTPRRLYLNEGDGTWSVRDV